jgi:hypothetical protein
LSIRSPTAGCGPRIGFEDTDGANIYGRTPDSRSGGAFGNNAFIFVDSAGTRRAGRYQILPATGIVNLDSLEASKAGPQYLFEDLPRRLAPVS